MRAAERIATGDRVPDVLLTSPLLRARETCQVLAFRVGVEPKIVDDLREIGVGDWEGLLHSVMAQRPGYSAWIRDPENHTPPGGERLSEAAARVVRALTGEAERNAGHTLAAFSHFDPMIGFYLSVTGRDFSEYPALTARNAMILIFDYDLDAGLWRFVSQDDRASEAVPDARRGEEPA